MIHIILGQTVSKTCIRRRDGIFKRYDLYIDFKYEILSERGEGRNAENRVRDKGKQVIHGNILCITNCPDEVHFHFYQE